MGTANSLRKIEFGDFQTPYSLALECCALLCRLGIKPSHLIEPTCGVGNFIAAGAHSFPSARSVFGLELNPAHSKTAGARLANDPRVMVESGDFFKFGWDRIFKTLTGHVLVFGNPPWVTSSVLGEMGGSNLPAKRNIDGLQGLDALTGKSNFDISESMLLANILRLNGSDATMAVLCKTSVARRLLLISWKTEVQCSRAAIYKIDSMKHFGAAVDACFFVMSFAPGAKSGSAKIYNAISDMEPDHEMGFEDGSLVSNVGAYMRNRHLQGLGGAQWRSGIKHDCSAVMELRREGSTFTNGLGEAADLEEDFVFPMYKSSDIANGNQIPTKWMLVPQRTIGESTDKIAEVAPRTWQYLKRHRAALSARQSIIYKARPNFSVFGVGPYSFAPWKVAISGLYKKLVFTLVGPYCERPVVFDDTIYFLPFWERIHAEEAIRRLRSPETHELLEAMIFWDAKRPITADILNRLYVEDPMLAQLDSALPRSTASQNLLLF